MKQNRELFSIILIHYVLTFLQPGSGQTFPTVVVWRVSLSNNFLFLSNLTRFFILLAFALKLTTEC